MLRRIFPVCVFVYLLYVQYAYCYVVCKTGIYDSGRRSAGVGLIVGEAVLVALLLASWALLFVAGPGSLPVAVPPYNLNSYYANGQLYVRGELDEKSPRPALLVRPVPFHQDVTLTPLLHAGPLHPAFRPLLSLHRHNRSAEQLRVVSVLCVVLRAALFLHLGVDVCVFRGCAQLRPAPHPAPGRAAHDRRQRAVHAAAADAQHVDRPHFPAQRDQHRLPAAQQGPAVQIHAWLAPVEAEKHSIASQNYQRTGPHGTRQLPAVRQRRASGRAQRACRAASPGNNPPLQQGVSGKCSGLVQQPQIHRCAGNRCVRVRNVVSAV
ncbi:hypothetical protein KL942_004904 [Ogataea angusta]|uniref:Uncharacterized protein n=1 Tax=Pichia angusta TaxID=870730 RepID=A0ABQ7RQS2_PICAN|nr:hypothetical protein KL942_004904 [Ogataea angusta]KAG7845929.1 hypothetical protein KL940_004768 [Ogataea angusta]